jgi:hypothetical protein
MNFNSLSKEQITQLYMTNLNIIAELTLEIDNLRVQNEELKKDKEKYYEIIEENKKLIENHELKIKNLEKEKDELHMKIKEQNNKIIKLEEDIKHQNTKITILEKDIIELKERDEPITIRESFVSLEKYIMMEILGSIKKIRSFDNIKDLFKSNEYKTECNDFLALHKITRDHIYLIPVMKKYGNQSAHKRPVITRTEFENIALSLSDDDDDKDMIKDLLKYLELKNPYDLSTGLWNIVKPFK